MSIRKQLKVEYYCCIVLELVAMFGMCTWSMQLGILNQVLGT